MTYSLKGNILIRTNIVLMMRGLSNTFGVPSILVATKMALSDVFPDVEYTVLIPYANYKSDAQLAPRYDVKIAACPRRIRWLLLLALLKRCTGISVGPVCVRDAIQSLRRADIAIDIRGIIFTDKLGSNSFFGRMSEGIIFIVCRILGKSVIKYTSSIGAFNQRWNRIFAKIYLGRFTQLILARDEISRKYLEELAIRTPILTVPDTAFLLPSSESEVSRYYAAVRKASLLIGLSVSFQAKNRSPKSNDYVLTMVDFVRYLIDKYAAHVVLIPNQQSGELSNDHQIALDISQKVNNVQCDVLDTSNLLAQEIKGVIGQCEAIVAARYHTIVASLSLGIPTLAIGWHHKYAGVLEIFRQEHRICNIEKLSFEDLVEKFDDLWQNREEIRQTIAAFIPHVKEQIAAGARAVRDIMSAKAK